MRGTGSCEGSPVGRGARRFSAAYRGCHSVLSPTEDWFMRQRIVLTLVLALAALSLGLTSSASAYAPAATAAIHPGVQTFTNGAQCTSNFVFSDGTSTYLGQAAHCSGTGGNTAT